MGGKVFGFDTKRVNLVEYNETRDSIIQALYPYITCSVSPNSLFKIMTSIKSVTEKESFGDVDILVNADFVDVELFIAENSLKYLIKRNSDSSIISLLDGNMVQIDLILVNSHNHITNYNYLNYNCVGNFMSKLAHGLSLKYGLEGLLLPVKDGKDIVAHISISKNLQEICKILDLDYIVYLEGFKTYTDVFKFIMASKHYNRSLFMLENATSKNKQRNKKRKDYNDFLAYIEKYDTAPYKHHLINIYDALRTFSDTPSIINQYLDIKSAIEDSRGKAKLFNGKLVQRITGLKGKELGIFIKDIKYKIDYTLPVEPQICVLYGGDL